MAILVSTTSKRIKCKEIKNAINEVHQFKLSQPDLRRNLTLDVNSDNSKRSQNSKLLFFSPT